MSRLCVCIPTWNGARHLPRTLQSVLAQQVVDLHVIVGDDGSDDNTLDVAQRTRDRRLEVHAFADRLGLAGNWNRLLRMADGDYVSVVGQDDEVDSMWAAHLVGALDRHPEADLAFGRRRFLFEDEESRRAVGDFFERWYPGVLAGFYARIGDVIPPEVMIEEAHRHRFEINLIGEPSFAIVRRSSPAVAAGFDTALSQMIDWEFFTRFFVDRPIVHCPVIVGTYRIHARSASVGNVSLLKHYREFDDLLGIVLQRFAAVLGDRRTVELEQRRREIQERHEEMSRNERPIGTG